MITNVTANATTIDNGIATPANAAIGIGRKRTAAVGVITAIEVMTACRTFRLRFRCEGPGSRFSAVAWLTGSLLCHATHSTAWARGDRGASVRFNERSTRLRP